MKALLETEGRVTILTLLDQRLDTGNAGEFKRAMTVRLAGKTNVVFDLSGVKSIDSSGLGAILFCLRQLNINGGDLKLCGMMKPVRALFQLVRLHRVIDVYNTKEEAVHAFLCQRNLTVSDVPGVRMRQQWAAVE